MSGWASTARTRRSLGVRVAGTWSGRVARLAWYPALFALADVIELVIISEVQLAAASRVIVLVVGASVLLTAAVTVALRDPVRAGPIALAVVLTLLRANRPLLALVMLAAVVLLLLERRLAMAGRVRLPWPRIHEALTLIGGILVVLQVLRLVAAPHPTAPTFNAAWEVPISSLADRRDLFIIVSDAHGRADVLRDGFGYDPSPMLDGLTDNGFSVASGSRSNYLFTELSLTSFLAGAHLRELGLDLSQPLRSNWPSAAIAANPTFKLLRRIGYETLVVSSGYEHLGFRSADRFVDTGQANELEVVFARGTSFLTRDIAVPLAFEGARDRTPASIDALVQVARSPAPSPQLVLAHIASPHFPYVVDASCRPIPWGPGTMGAVSRSNGRADAHGIDLVAQQTACIDSLLGEALRAIAEARPDAIVVLMSDHGPDERLSWNEPDAVGLADRSAVLFAARTPGQPDLFPDDITLVNVLPILFNAYLGTDLPLRPDEVWFGPRPQDRTFVLVDAG